MCSCYFFWWIKLNHVFILLYHCLLIFETGFLHFRKEQNLIYPSYQRPNLNRVSHLMYLENKPC